MEKGEAKNNKRIVFRSIITAILGALSLNVVYCVPSIEDCTGRITEYLTCVYISSISPWSGEMTGPITLIGKLGENFSRFTFSAVLLMVCLFFCTNMICKRLNSVQISKNYNVITYMVSIAFGLMQVMGFSAHYFQTLAFCLSSAYQVFLSAVVAAGYAMLFKLVFDALYYAVNLWHEKDKEYTEYKAIINREIVIYGIILAAVYLVWIVVFYPGSVDWDSHASVDFFLSGNMNQHHPVLTTWIHVVTLLIGRKLGSDNIGAAIYVVMQTIVVIYAFLKTIWIQQRINAPVFLRRLSIAFYSLVPVFGIFIQSNIKNTLFMGVFVIFLCNLAEVLLIEDERTQTFVRMTVSAIFSCLLLNNAIYVVLILLLILAVCEGVRKQKKPFIVTFAIVFVFNIMFSILCTDILKYDKISDNGAGEAYSLPCMCTSYYLRNNMNSLTDKEKEVLSKVFTCDPQTLADGYIHGLSDGVKGNWNNESSLLDKLSYFALWIQEGATHPITYAEAILNQSYGYYVLAPTDNISNAGKESYMNYQMEYSDYSYHLEYKQSGGIRDLFSAYTHLFERNSFTGILTNQGFTTWLLIAMMMIFAFRKDKKCNYLVGILLIFILTCIASPVNALLRYYLPVFGAMPLMWGLVFGRRD